MIPLCLCIIGHGVQVPDICKHTGICCRIGARCSSDGRLVNINYLVQIFNSVNGVKIAVSGTRPVQLCRQVLIENLIDQRGFSGTGNAGNTGKGTQWNGHIYIFQIVFSGTVYCQIVSVARTSLEGKRYIPLAAEILPSNRLFTCQQALYITGIYNISPVNSCTGANVHHIVRR